MKRASAWVWIGGASALAAYYALFSQWMPNRVGGLGHDYALNLPRLLAGYYWYSQNGLLALPWYTPAFCGGVPLIADPQSLYVSVPQLLTVAMDPARSVYASFYAFAAAGYLGTYLLLRSAFGASRSAASLAGVLFLFNGFYTWRMVIGHLTFQGYMLLPLVAWLCLRPSDDRLKSSALAGAALGYVFLSGGVHVLPIIVLAAVAIGLMRGLRQGGDRSFWARLALTTVFAASLSAFKWVPALAYAGHFPRDRYKLPGAETFLGSAWTAFFSLFLERDAGFRVSSWENIQWALGPTAFEHGVTVVPLLVFAVGAVFLVRRGGRPRLANGAVSAASLRAVALVAIGLVPIALNTYTVGWNAFLKTIPFVRSSSLLTQWYALYIPIVVVATALVFDCLPLGRFRPYVAAALAAGVVASNLVFSHTWMHDAKNAYAPEPIVDAWERVRSGAASPRVDRVALSLSLWRNDALASNATSLACREAMFGYHLEDFPRAPLRPGPVDLEGNGLLNLKRPECYVYPEVNDCRAGEHFVAAERTAFEQFRSYRPHPAAAPRRQSLANGLSALTLAWMGGLALMEARRALRRRG